MSIQDQLKEIEEHAMQDLGLVRNPQTGAIEHEGGEEE